MGGKRRWGLVAMVVAASAGPAGLAGQWAEAGPARFDAAELRAEWAAASTQDAAPAPSFAGVAAQGADRSFGAALGIEWAGGFAGSLAGLGLGALIVSDDCNSEDLGCLLTDASITLLIGTAGSAVGAYAAGRWQETDPSLLGAVIGSIAGAVAGIGMDHLVAEDIDLIRDEGVRIVLYSATQGLVTALGSRIGDALRR